MKTTRRTEVVRHLSEEQLDEAIGDPQKADETRLVRRLLGIIVANRVFRDLHTDAVFRSAAWKLRAPTIIPICFIKNVFLGDTDEMAPRRVGASQPTDGRWLKAWNERGVDGLRPRFAGGRPAKLSPYQFEEFFSLLEEGQPWTPPEIDDLLWDRYGVTYDLAHLARILRADGMQYAKPRPVDPRQSPDAEADFHERLGSALTKETDDEQLILGFFDASWPQPFENYHRIWSYERTVGIDKPLVTVPWKTLGFYALLGTSTLIFRKRTTKESICAALEAIHEQNPVGRILLIADNDGVHHAHLTQQRVNELGIEFVFLPPHSPNFNAIEPLWESLKRKIIPEIFEDKGHFRQFVTDTFLGLSKRVSFADNWIKTFLPDIQKLGRPLRIGAGRSYLRHRSVTHSGWSIRRINH